MKKQILQVGFDLDGVLLYNPARILRPVIAFTKRYFLNRDTKSFYYPKNRLEQLAWAILHKSSLWPAPGLPYLRSLLRQNKIKGYVVSARYESLQSDFLYWMKKIDPDNLFSGRFYNNKNEQPHLFKKRMIETLNLDIFVEDNWDIVNHIVINSSSKNKNRRRSKTKVFWIYNFLDRHIPYQYKFPTLESVVKYIADNQG